MQSINFNTGTNVSNFIPISEGRNGTQRVNRQPTQRILLHKQNTYSVYTELQDEHIHNFTSNAGFVEELSFYNTPNPPNVDFFEELSDWSKEAYKQKLAQQQQVQGDLDQVDYDTSLVIQNWETELNTVIENNEKLAMDAFQQELAFQQKMAHQEVVWDSRAQNLVELIHIADAQEEALDSSLLGSVNSNLSNGDFMQEMDLEMLPTSDPTLLGIELDQKLEDLNNWETELNTIIETNENLTMEDFILERQRGQSAVMWDFKKQKTAYLNRTQQEQNFDFCLSLEDLENKQEISLDSGVFEQSQLNQQAMDTCQPPSNGGGDPSLLGDFSFDSLGSLNNGSYTHFSQGDLLGFSLEQQSLLTNTVPQASVEVQVNPQAMLALEFSPNPLAVVSGTEQLKPPGNQNPQAMNNLDGWYTPGGWGGFGGNKNPQSPHGGNNDGGYILSSNDGGYILSSDDGGSNWGSGGSNWGSGGSNWGNNDGGSNWGDGLGYACLFIFYGVLFLVGLRIIHFATTRSKKVLNDINQFLAKLNSKNPKKLTTKIYTIFYKTLVIFIALFTSPETLVLALRTLGGPRVQTLLRIFSFLSRGAIVASLFLRGAPFLINWYQHLMNIIGPVLDKTINILAGPQNVSLPILFIEKICKCFLASLCSGGVCVFIKNFKVSKNKIQNCLFIAGFSYGFYFILTDFIYIRQLATRIAAHHLVVPLLTCQLGRMSLVVCLLLLIRPFIVLPGTSAIFILLLYGLGVYSLAFSASPNLFPK